MIRRIKLDNLKVLTKNKKPEKNLLVRIKKTGGRGSNGRITSWNKGGGARKLYRIIDFKQTKKDIPAEVVSLEYDPNRTAFIALLRYEDGDKKYIIAPQGLKVGAQVITAEKAEPELGNRMKLKNIPEGSMIYNIELLPDMGGKVVRSAGATAILLSKDSGYCHIKMPSSEVRKISEECYASLGAVSNPEHRYIRWEKAGKSRRKGIRPHVRGTAMNPCDHPHGGGECGSPIGMKYPKTPWGKHALGVKTRNKSKWTSKLIVQRRVKKKRKK
ncbi:MAG: 50S ribosomal protein L2 [Minisyncoccus archaeiphilus]|uniref:50S ribosomal protein L2 n=1 Tax=Minisyncoccus archaeiphilus TaxID=3238481 RepID=UPI002B17692C|nr:MAG: 50S ribosomal protein L2 [Candidatus Parcubacteria bacterium]